MRLTLFILILSGLTLGCGKHTIGKKKDRTPNPKEGLYELLISADYNDGEVLIEKQEAKVQHLKGVGYILNHAQISLKYIEEKDAYFLQYFKPNEDYLVPEGSLYATDSVNELDDLIILSWSIEGKPLKMIIYL